MKERLILTDADGVLLDWNTAFEEWMINKGYERLPDTDHHYNLSWRFNATVTQARNEVIEFNQSDKMETLEPLPGAVEAVATLVDNGFRFVCITSLSDHPDAKTYRSKNLADVFGDAFDDLICLPVGETKDHILEQWEDEGLFWLEDHCRNAQAGFELGLTPILFDTPYNAHFDTDLFTIATMDDPWSTVLDEVFDEYDI